MTAGDIIRHLQLSPLEPEGGWIRVTHRSAGISGEDRSLSSAIYYLLDSRPDCFSALHRLPADETWHFYLGSPMEMLLLYPDGTSRRKILGPEILSGQEVQFTVPAGVWQGTRLLAGGDWALAGTTMSPAFISSDYHGGERSELIRMYPEEKNLITALTRPGASLRMS